MSLTTYPLLTFYDAVDHVLDHMVGGSGSLRNKRLAIDAVKEAYDEVPYRRNWRYYYRPLTIQTVAAQTSSTITYDYTGGSSERIVTIAAGTWPDDAEKYALVVSGVRYSVATRVSSTILQLDEKDCPTTDIAAGTSYTLVRDTYELPENCRKILTLYQTDAPGRLIHCVDPGDIIMEQRVTRTSAVPTMYSVYRSERFASGVGIHFAPSCTSALKYQALGLFGPAPLKTLDYSGIGTVATTADSSTVTGTSTTFSTDHVGAVMRFSESGSLKIPTDQRGEIDKDRLNPYAMQKVIKSRTSSTVLVLEQAADLTLSGSGYRISSRVDIEPGAMRTAFLRCCEAKFATQDRKGHAEREAIYEKALALAMQADQRMEETIAHRYWPRNLADMAASVDATGD